MKRPLLLLAFLLLPPGCRRAVAPPPPATLPAPPAMLAVGLSSGAAPVAELVAGPYAAATAAANAGDNPRALLHFVPGNDDALFEDLAAGRLDALLVHHIPEQGDYWFNPVALDGLVILVHPDNPVRALSRAQVQAIFNGRVDNWAEAGGHDAPITLAGREPGAGARTLFNRRIMAEERTSIQTVVCASDAALRAAVAADPSAAGYSFLGARTADTVSLAIDGVAPTIQSVASQAYPLTVPLYFVAPAEPKGELRAFLAWLQAEDGQKILGEKYGRVR